MAWRCDRGSLTTDVFVDELTIEYAAAEPKMICCGLLAEYQQEPLS